MPLDTELWRQQIFSTSTRDALENLRIQLLGKSGEITQHLRRLGQLDPAQRKEQGAQINTAKEHIQQWIQEQRTRLEAAALDEQLRQEKIDVTLPGYPGTHGGIHPVTQTIHEIQAYFSQLGFRMVYGPNIEDDEHNFTALNFPPDHPARQAHDTFYLRSDDTQDYMRLLRTHTSTVQIRTMRTSQPPIRILAAGRTYRCDHDATHTPMFHQMEGLVIDRDIHMGHLKNSIIDFCRHFFAINDLKLRFRPSFFPFTEPSAEVDIQCDRQQHFKIGSGHDWLEVLGCGMVHPQVLRNCGIDPEHYQGFAFGLGIDRFAMLKYAVPDLRSFFEGDIRWLKHYNFSPFVGARS